MKQFLGSLTRVVCDKKFKQKLPNKSRLESFWEVCYSTLTTEVWMMMTFRSGPALMTSDDCVATVDDHAGFLAKFGLSERYW